MKVFLVLFFTSKILTYVPDVRTPSYTTLNTIVETQSIDNNDDDNDIEHFIE